MARIAYKYLYPAITGLLFSAIVTACSKSENGDDPVLDPPALISSSPEDGATNIAIGDITIVLTYDQNVTSPSSGHGSVTLGDATIGSVSASLKEVTIEATGLEQGMTYELVVPAGVILVSFLIGGLEIIKNKKRISSYYFGNWSEWNGRKNTCQLSN